jgi:hypothetical protein
MLSPGLQTLPPPSQALLPAVSSLSITNTADLVGQTTWQLTSQVRQLGINLNQLVVRVGELQE